MRIHFVLRIPDGLEVAEGLHQFRTKHLRKQRAAGLSVAVFSRKRAPVFHDQVGGALNELGIVPDSLLGEQIEADLHVDAAMAEVTVVRRLIVVGIQQLTQFPQVGAKPVRSNGGVVPSFEARRHAGPAAGRPRSGLANAPHGFRLGLCIKTHVRGIRKPR